jgi:hypothetical protein
MPTFPSGRAVRLLFMVFIVCALALSFALGNLTGRLAVHRHYARFSIDPSTADLQEKLELHIIRSAQRIREDEYVELRTAVERHKAQAPAEHGPIIDECLRAMRERRAESASQRPKVEWIAEGR